MKSTFSSGNRNARWCTFLAKLAILRGGRFRLAAFLAVLIVGVPLGRAQAPVSNFSLSEVSRPSVGTSPFGTALVDLNGDGHLDIVASNYGSGTISVLLSGPNGTLGTPTNYAVGSHPLVVVSGDFNRDGKPDIAVTVEDSNSVAILLNDSHGGLLAPQYSPVGSSPFALVVADFNRDGVLDLAVTNSGASTVSVLMGTGAGSFAPQVTYSVGSTPLALVAGDLNTDGAADLVVGNFSSNTVSVLLNDGAGHFSPGGNYGTGNGPNALALGDIDNDGRLDLAVTDWYDDALSVLKGNGNGSFAPARQVYLYYGAWPNGVRLIDIDRDGHLDLVVGDYGGDWNPPAYDGVALLLGDGAGNFGTSTLYKAGYRPQGLGLSIGDVNGDGVLDVVIANVGGGVSILAGSGGAGNCVAPPPGLVGWWTGDGNANDISGTGLNGTVRDGVSFSDGKVSLAFDFDGVDDRVEIADSPALHFGTGDLTVDAWIKAPPGASYRSIIGKEQQSFPFPSIVLRISDQGLLEFAVTDCGTGDCGFSSLGGGGSRQPVQSPFRVDDDAFHHVAGVRHSSGYELYVDGQLVATRTEPARNSDNGAPLFIGIQAIATDSSFMIPFKGIIDEVEIFNRALTASEIQAVFNSDSAGKCKNATPPQLTELGAASVWIGLKNSDDVGTKFDLLAEVLKNGSTVGSGQLNGVPGGSSGFNNAVSRTINLALSSPVSVGSGDTLSIRLSVRIAVGVAGHRSGTARLWFNDGAANSHFDATIGGTTSDYVLLNGGALGTSAGSGPKTTIDVFVDRAVGGNPFKPFGTWSKTF